MNLTQIKSNIQHKEISPVYVFTGEEIGVMNIYIEQIAKALNQQVYRADAFREVIGPIRRKSAISTSYVYVIRDDKEVLENERIWEYLNVDELPFEAAPANSIFGSNVVIFAFTNIDKRTKFYKQHKDLICEFLPLDAAILTKYIKKSIELSDKNCQTLIEACQNNYNRIMLEVDKIKCWRAEYIKDKQEPIPYDGAFLKMINNGVIHTPARDAIFMWNDAVMSKKKAQSFKLMQECFDSGEAVLPMLTVLYNNVKQTLQLQTCEGKDVSKSTGLTGWQIQCAKKFAGIYSTSELLKAMETIREAEIGIKTGKMEEEMAVPYVMTAILGG